MQTKLQEIIARRMIQATKHSLAGFCSAWRTEEAFRIEVGLSMVILPLSFFIGTSWIEVVLLLGSAVLVLVVELINTALEKTVDRISHERHPLSAVIKDLGSAAVFLSIAFASLVWVLAVLDRLVG